MKASTPFDLGFEGIQRHLYDVICRVLERPCMSLQPLPGLLRNPNYRHQESVAHGKQFPATRVQRAEGLLPSNHLHVCDPWPSD